MVKDDSAEWDRSRVSSETVSNCPPSTFLDVRLAFVRDPGVALRAHCVLLYINNKRL